MKHKVLALLLLVAVATQASASLVFTDRAAWTSSTKVVQTIGFEGMTPDNSYRYQGGAVTVDGVNFSSNNSKRMYVVGGNYKDNGATFGVGTGAVLFSYNTGIQGLLPAAYNSFGVDVRGYNESSTAFTISFSNGEMFEVTANNPGGAFFGALLDSDITSFSIVPRRNYVAIDNVAFGNSVPEPASLALVGLGLAGLAVSRRRKAQA